jgi:hypothetical protein
MPDPLDALHVLLWHRQAASDTIDRLQRRRRRLRTAMGVQLTLLVTLGLLLVVYVLH